MRDCGLPSFVIDTWAEPILVARQKTKRKIPGFVIIQVKGDLIKIQHGLLQK
jgi:hypothetical protein